LLFDGKLESSLNPQIKMGFAENIVEVLWEPSPRAALVSLRLLGYPLPPFQG
jgi:hypothetical protein